MNQQININGEKKSLINKIKLIIVIIISLAIGFGIDFTMQPFMKKQNNSNQAEWQKKMHKFEKKLLESKNKNNQLEQKINSLQEEKEILEKELKELKKEKEILVKEKKEEIELEDDEISLDENKIKKAFIKYIGNSSRYKEENIYVKTDQITDKHFEGSILEKDSENLSSPNLLAVKINDNWEVIYWGQDVPSCTEINKHNFPTSMVNKCGNEEGMVMDRK